MDRFSFVQQPDAISCGPACIAMAVDAVGRRHGVRRSLDVARIGSICGTDAATGTPPERMTRGLSAFGLAFEFGDASQGLSLIDEAIRDGGLVLARTVTSGVPHWIALHGFADDGRVAVADPWLGERLSTRGELYSIMAPRHYQHYRVRPERAPSSVAVLSLAEAPVGSREGLIESVLDLVERSFRPAVKGDSSWVRGYARDASDWGLSRFLLVDGRLAGAYLLAERAPPTPEDWGRAVEGVALVLAPEFRGRGFGRMLRGEPERLGFDSAWGQQLKSLGNVAHWLRHRVLICEDGNSYFTGRQFRAAEYSGPSP